MPQGQQSINKAKALAEDARGQGQAGQAAIAYGLCAIAEVLGTLGHWPGQWAAGKRRED